MFLDMCKVYRRLDSNIARFALSLDKKLMKGEPLRFKHDNSEGKTINVLKKLMNTQSVWALP